MRNSQQGAPVFLVNARPVDRAWARELGVPLEKLQAPDPRRLAVIRTDDGWLEEPIGSEWVVAYRLNAQHGVPVVAEVRLFPHEPGRPQAQVGEWSAMILGSRATVPPGGVTARLLRAIRLGAHHRAAGQTLRQLRRALMHSPADQLEAVLLADTLERHRLTPIPARGKRGVPQPLAFYVRVAASYAAAVAAGHPAPAKLAAEQHGLGRAQMRKAIYRARRLHLLRPERPHPGKSDGTLTPLGRRLLTTLAHGPIHGPGRPRKARRRRPS
jgi:hypothetical protein